MTFGRRIRAFTLIELVLVAAIFGLIASIAVPRVAGFVAARHVEAAARRVVADVALAQRQAKFTSFNHKVTFSVADSAYLLPEVFDPDHPGGEYKVELDEEPYSAAIASAELGGDEEIIFDGYGIPDSGGTIVIRCGRYEKTLTVDPDTGRVSVSDLAFNEEITLPEQNPPEQIE
jgi:prepilin-type N-terminal cleavage/methylation domain-containing protein